MGKPGDVGEALSEAWFLNDTFLVCVPELQVNTALNLFEELVEH